MVASTTAQELRVADGGSLLTARIAPMLAYSSPPFDSPRHLFEIKWDGTRCLMFVRDHSVRLQNRRLQDITARYPEFAGLYRQIKGKNAILDGELVVLSQGRPDFRTLQQREQVADPVKISLLAQRIPATYMAFDVLYHDDKECLHFPLRQRKEILRDILAASDQVVESGYIRGQGKSFYRETVAQGLEGVMAKALDSPYLIGRRSRWWLKIKPRGTAKCFIAGYSQGQGARRQFFGALALATPGGEGWDFRGMVGSGFTVADLEKISGRLQELRVKSPVMPLTGAPRGITWVRPELRCEVTFQEETPRGHFRAPAFKRLIE
jgi:bifunctional non-homologous end joining protein LigD